ncbi:uncharacterized protein [Musca autumnalis]|uniref:uncharacterized protein n=1 Tax=Musca autumnalis TaxID=221902 RepID=UPI003CE6713E
MALELRVSWAYSLRKDDLNKYLKEFGCEVEGTVEEQRKRFAMFLAQLHDPEVTKRLLEIQAVHEKETKMASPRKLSESNNVETTGMEVPTLKGGKHDVQRTAEQVRKWGVTFTGESKPLEFIERLEERAEMYQISNEGLVMMMPEVLHGRALMWYRNNRKPWRTWEAFRKDFLKFFLPPRFMENLEDEIRQRKQKPRELFKDYMLAMQDLMRHSEHTEEEKTERIFRNALPEYQWYIRRKDFGDLAGLLETAEDLEGIPSLPNVTRDHHRQIEHVEPKRNTEAAINPATACRRCGQEGHFAASCRNPQKLFCWDCGRRATIDTGATKCFMKESFAESIAPDAIHTIESITISLADGSKRRIQHVMFTEVLFGCCRLNVEFLLMPDASENIILGMDFLRRNETRITCAGQSCLLPKPEERNETEYSKEGCRHVTITPGQTDPCGKNSNVSNPVRPGKPEHNVDELGRFKDLHGVSTVASHRIVMNDDRPFKLRYAARNPAMQSIIYEKVNELLAKGFIEPSRSAYNSPITLARKKNGTWRLCMDFRHLNSKSSPDAYPLPRISSILDRLREANFVSSLDLKDGYWQIPLEESSRKYTAFTVPGRGLYQWRVMPFGLHSAPATFQRALDTVIGADMEPHAFAYLDDIIVIGRTLEEHLANLREVFRRLREVNLRINPEKCEFFKKETKYLGHVVSAQGIHTDPDKVAAIRELPAPTTLKELRRFLGVVSWYRRFVPEFATIAYPLTSMLKKGKHWRWTEDQQMVFEILKIRLTEAPVLACPNFTVPFTLQTDASDYGLGAVLTQVLEGTERVIAYASRVLNGAERNYSATEKECLAIIWGIRKMRPYLEGYTFNVITDHLSLKWLNSIENPSGRLARWALELQQYTFSVQYRKGRSNVVADALSRQPLEYCQGAKIDTQGCSWVARKLESMKSNPEKFADYAVEIGVHHQFTAPYCPQENPTERANRTIKTMIAQVSHDKHNRWDDFLPEISLAINTATSESTGYSPAYLVQCREPRLPATLYDEAVPGTGNNIKSPEERASELQEVFRIVRNNLSRAAEEQRRHYNLRRRPWKPAIGERVLVKQHPQSKAVDQFAAKLAPKYDGPFEVIEFISPSYTDIEIEDEQHSNHNELNLKYK